MTAPACRLRGLFPPWALTYLAVVVASVPISEIPGAPQPLAWLPFVLTCLLSPLLLLFVFSAWTMLSLLSPVFDGGTLERTAGYTTLAVLNVLFVQLVLCVGRSEQTWVARESGEGGPWP